LPGSCLRNASSALCSIAEAERVDIRVCLGKPNTHVGRLNSCVLREKVSKRHGFADCIFCRLMIDRLDTITKSRKCFRIEGTNDSSRPNGSCRAQRDVADAKQPRTAKKPGGKAANAPHAPQLREATSFTCPSAVLTTAATHSRRISRCSSRNMQTNAHVIPAKDHPFCASEQSFRLA
jgi:hypothetical protein